MVGEEFPFKVFVDTSLNSKNAEIYPIFEALKKIPCSDFYFYFLTFLKAMKFGGFNCFRAAYLLFLWLTDTGLEDSSL